MHLKWQHESLRIMILRPMLNAKNAKIKLMQSFPNLQYLSLRVLVTKIESKLTFCQNLFQVIVLLWLIALSLSMAKDS